MNADPWNLRLGMALSALRRAFPTDKPWPCAGLKTCAPDQNGAGTCMVCGLRIDTALRDELIDQALADLRPES